jgi:hypothetical protein
VVSLKQLLSADRYIYPLKQLLSISFSGQLFQWDDISISEQQLSQWDDMSISGQLFQWDDMSTVVR